MMPLSTMWKVDATVDATGSSPIAERILARWVHDTNSARLFRSSANFLYTFKVDGKRHFLRFADSTERELEAIAAEIALIEWLAGEGLRVAAPVRSKDDRVIESVETDVGLFHAVVFTALEGTQFEEVDELSEARFAEWGAALGTLHAALKRYRGPALSARRSWRDDLVMIRKYLPDGAPALHMEWQEISDALNSLPVDGDRYGLIHFDFELDNLVWGEDGIGMLDFDDCAQYWYVADISFALRDLFGELPNLSDPRFREFIRGYTTHNPLNEESTSQVPLFLRLAKLLQYARMARSLDLATNQHYPDWLLSLSTKLQTRMEAYQKRMEERGG